MKNNYTFLAAMLFTASAAMAQPGNYLVNGGFEDDARGWIAVSGAEAMIDFSIENDAAISGSKSAKIEVTGTGAAAFESALIQHFTIHKDVEVEVSFTVQASAETFINLEVARSYGDFNGIIVSPANIVANENIPVGTEAQTITYTATSSYSDAFYKIAFMFGTTPSGVTIWIDDVEIRQTNGMWDGNIAPNSELDEIWETDPSFPVWRESQLAFSITPWVDGGWEGGFLNPEFSNMVFRRDETSKLSGEYSFAFDVTNKTASDNPEVIDFWTAANPIFFYAHQDEVYELSFEVVASEVLDFAVAMNEEPFNGPDQFFFPIAATTEPQTLTVVGNATTASQMHKIFFANLPIGSNYQIYIDNVRMLRQGAADQPSSTESERSLSGIHIFPNPTATDNFNVDLSESNVPSGKNMVIELYSLDGKRVHSQNEVAADTQIAISKNLNAGVYIVRITCENNVYMQKLVKQ